MKTLKSTQCKIVILFIGFLFLTSGITVLGADSDWDSPPSPENGFKAIQKVLDYPELARKNGIQGTVTLKVHVSDKGEIEDVKIVKSLDSGCDEAAVQALKAVAWKPAVKDNKSISAWFSIDVKFRLE